MSSKYSKFIFIVLLVMVGHASYLDTSSKSVLSLADFLTSPQGNFRVRLLGNCSLQLQAFNETSNQYQVSSVLTGGANANSACTYLNLSLPAQSLLDSSGRLFKRSTVTTQQFNQLRMKVNDVGTVSLVSYYQGPDNQVQYVVDYFQNGNDGKQGHFLYNLQSPVTYKNKNNWQFVNNRGLVTVRKADQGSGETRMVDLQGYQFTQIGLMDPQGQVRYANVPGMKMQSKAGGTGCNSIQGVYAEFDDYWPAMRIYDEDNHLLAEYWANENLKTACPSKIFEHQGDCKTNCPLPYYKEMNGKYGNCVLNCKSNYVIDEKLKTCTLPNQNPILDNNLNKILNRNCPSDSIQYEYGCSCSNSKFYDFENNICLDKCPDGSSPVSGICMSCPSNCKTCQIDQSKSSFLTCVECLETFSGPSCSIGPTTCQQIQNCAKCTLDANRQEICSKCSPFYALSSSNRACLLKCASDQTFVSGNGGEAYCQKFAPGTFGTVDDFIGGVYSGNPYLIRKSGTCPQGYKILRDKCVANCPDGTDPNADRRCICGPGFATLANDTCQKISEINNNELGIYYNSTLNAFLNCPMGCLSCQYGSCFQCSPNYVLVASGSNSVCRQQSLHFNCNSDFYTFDSVNKVCMTNSLIKVGSNITNCKTEYKRRCIVCKPGYFIFELNCVSNCNEGYSKANGRCIKSLDNCQVPELRAVPVKTVIDSSVLSSLAYRSYSSNRVEISNDPYTEILAVRDQLGIASNTPMTATLFQSQVACKVKSGQPNVQPPNVKSDVCTDSSKPYLLLNGTCVNQCPVNTYFHVPEDGKSPMCLTFTTCYEKNNSMPFRMPDGTCVSSCPQGTVPTQFGNGTTVQCNSLTQCQKINTMTPFELPNTLCSSACPPGTAPQLVDTVNLKCLPLNNSNVASKIHIDSSVFNIGQEGPDKRRLFYFVVDKVLNLSDINVNYYKYNSDKAVPMVSQSKLLQQPSTNSLDLTQFNDKTYLAISSLADQVVLDLSKNIKQFSTADGNRLASSIYGVRANENRIHNTRSWLAIIAYVLSLLLIILHSIYVGNQLLYKVDNFLIFAQTLYFFSFVHLLINTSIGQFFYGFLWSHFGFFPNYFSPTIPQNYMEGYFKTQDPNLNYLPNSYRLLTGDANFIRNAGFSFSLLLTFVFAFLVIVGIILLLKKICGKYELWHKRIAKQALIAAFEFVSMNIFYWAVAHLLCNRNMLFSGVPGEPSDHVAFRTSCSAASIAWICIYGVYMILRFIKNKIGGLYMFKRLAFATILAASAYHNNGDQKYKLFLIPLVAAEIIFMILRFVFEKPYLKRQKVFIILETVLTLIAFFTIYLWNDTGFVSIFCSLVLFLFIFLFTQDLMDVYLDNKDEYYNDNVKLMPGLRQKQFSDGDEYVKVHNGESLPESDRRLRNE